MLQGLSKGSVVMYSKSLGGSLFLLGSLVNEQGRAHFGRASGQGERALAFRRGRVRVVADEAGAGVET